MLVLTFLVLMVPGLILGKPRHHHHTHKRQHVAINLENHFHPDETTINELQMAKEEDDMIKSQLLPNMKDVYIQREEAKLEQDSRLKYPLSSGGVVNDFAPAESASKKFFDDDSQNFWVGDDNNNNNNKIEGREDEENKMVKQQHGLPSDDETAKEVESSKFINNNDIEENRGKNQEESANFNEENNNDRKTTNSKDGATAAMRRDSFHDSEDFNDGFKTDDNNSDNAISGNELGDPKAKLPHITAIQHHRETQNQDQVSNRLAGNEMGDSSKRFTTDDSMDNIGADVKPDSQISNVLKSVFGQGDSQFPMQKVQYFEK